MKKKMQVLSAFMGAVILSLGAGAAVKAEEADTIHDGVYISDVDVSGMTAEEAKAAVEEKAGGEEDAADHQRDRHPGAPVG